MFGIKRLTKQLAENSDLLQDLLGRVNRLENRDWYVDTSEITDPLLDIPSPVRYPFYLSANEIVAHFEKLYDHLGITMSEELNNLGYANSWSETPEIVRECREKGHQPDSEEIGRCLREIKCRECGYFYKIDSGD